MIKKFRWFHAADNGRGYEDSPDQQTDAEKARRRVWWFQNRSAMEV